MTHAVPVVDSTFDGAQSALGARAEVELIAVAATYSVSQFLVALGVAAD